ncbi:MAG: 4-amino-4-deoxy-L-arabinose transferase-like glycosyltransferase, partial [Polyangiales bacterium]
MSFLRRFSVSLGFLPPLMLLLVGIGAFGIWDPWELNIADEARAMSEGTVSDEVRRHAPLGRSVIARSFSAFGVSEESGRLPMAFAGFLLLLAAFFAGRRFDSKRAGLYATAVLASTPIVILNSRGMFGDSFAMAANAFVGLCACQLAFGKAKVPEAQKKHIVLWGLGLLGAVVFAFYAAGALSGIVPPLAAVALVSVLRIGSTEDALQKKTLIGLAIFGAGVTAKTAWDINADAASYSAWLGGAPFGGEPPTFDSALERVFHGFGPWAGLMVLALARLLAPANVAAAKEESEPAPDGDTFHFRVTLLLWAAFGYGALMLYTARYGESTFHSVAPVGIAIALFLRDMERSGRSWWGEAVVASLLVALVLRDYALFPGTAVDSLPVLDLTTPEVFNPRSKWAAFLLLFLVVQGLGFISGNEFREKPDWKAPYKFVAARWNEDREPFAKKWQVVLFMIFWPLVAFSVLGALWRMFVKLSLWRRFIKPSTSDRLIFEGLQKFLGVFSANRVWLSLGAGLLFTMALFGGICFAFGDALPLTSIAIRAGRRLLFVPLAIPVLIAGGQMALWLYSRLDGRRALPILAA